MTLDKMRNDGNWWEAFVYARQPEVVIGEDVSSKGFGLDDVYEIISSIEGEHDGPNWMGVFRLKDGRFAFLSAGCDFSGWDCQASGYANVASSLERLIRFGISQGDRKALNMSLEEDHQYNRD